MIGRPVALKTMSPSLETDEKFAQRFRHRGARRGRPFAPQHRYHLRDRPGRQHALHRHGVPGGTDLERLIATHAPLPLLRS